MIDFWGFFHRPLVRFSLCPSKIVNQKMLIFRDTVTWICWWFHMRHPIQIAMYQILRIHFFLTSMKALISQPLRPPQKSVKGSPLLVFWSHRVLERTFTPRRHCFFALRNFSTFLSSLQDCTTLFLAFRSGLTIHSGTHLKL